MSERWRCFVAVPLGDELRADLAAAVAGWRDRPEADGLRWTDADAWHLTLAFLGSVDADRVPALEAAMRKAAVGHPPVQLALGGLGAFPSRRHARVVWIGVADPDRRLAGLAADLRRALGVDAAAPFRAHVTLARARSTPVDVRDLVRDARAPEGTISVDEIDLMRSHLGRGPARYERLAAARLGAPARV